MFGDSFFSKIEKKTNVDKGTILDIAKKIESKDLKDESVLRDLVDEIACVAGKEISDEKKNKIVKTIMDDKVPNDITKMI